MDGCGADAFRKLHTLFPVRGAPGKSKLPNYMEQSKEME